ncbi:MAG: hypothetical protein ACKN9V_05560 [Pseudomonadota bacterium]
MKYFLFFFSVFSLCSCRNTPVRFMFQNAVGLNLNPAGCSILDLGGASRMCERVRIEKPDLFFQVGPAFSMVIPRADVSTEQVSKLQRALVLTWNEAHVSFYSVDGEDLGSGLKSFLEVTSQKTFSLLSTNIRDRQGKPPFNLFQKTDWNEASFLFLGFTTPKSASRISDWQAVPFKDALESLNPILKENAQAQIVVLGSLSQSQRQEILNLIAQPVYFLGGSLEEDNTTEWIPMGGGSFWGKAVDLGRGMGKIEWNSAPSMAFKTEFSSKGLRKDLDAVNQCTKIIEDALGSSR